MLRDDPTVPATRSGVVPADDLAAFVDSWPGVAATLVDRHLNVTGASPLSTALFPRLTPGVNLALALFLEVVPAGTCRSADEIGYQLVAALHASLAWHEDDPAFERLVGELSTMSREFSTAWAAPRRELRPHGVVRTTHPTAGDLAIGYQLIELAAGANDVLIVWSAADASSEPGFASLVATR